MRLALAVAVLLLAPAAAWAEWTGQTLSSSQTFIDGTVAIAGGDGDVLAAWRYQEGLGTAAARASRARDAPPARPASAHAWRSCAERASTVR